mmetsp:Transcript_1438/g.4553  ORF Transcript_1438/g.4553 Transcript_1438/m.4553 type:complete len:303 (-) Transcript_1438:468-1376(-)
MALSSSATSTRSARLSRARGTRRPTLVCVCTFLVPRRPTTFGRLTMLVVSRPRRRATLTVCPFSASSSRRRALRPKRLRWTRRTWCSWPVVSPTALKVSLTPTRAPTLVPSTSWQPPSTSTCWAPWSASLSSSAGTSMQTTAPLPSAATSRSTLASTVSRTRQSRSVAPRCTPTRLCLLTLSAPTTSRRSASTTPSSRCRSTPSRARSPVSLTWLTPTTPVPALTRPPSRPAWPSRVSPKTPFRKPSFLCRTVRSLNSRLTLTLSSSTRTIAMRSSPSPTAARRARCLRSFPASAARLLPTA